MAASDRPGGLAAPAGHRVQPVTGRPGGDNVLAALEQDNGTPCWSTGVSYRSASTTAPSERGRGDPRHGPRDAGPASGELTDTVLAVTEVRRIDVDQLSPQFPGTVAPVYLDLIASDPPTEGTYPAPVPPPELSEGPTCRTRSQWFIFSIAVVVGWVLAVRRSIHSRRDGNLEHLSRPARHSLQISDDGDPDPDAASGAQETSERSGVAAGEATAE